MNTTAFPARRDRYSATTMRVVTVKKIGMGLDGPRSAHIESWEIFTAWAGDPTPRPRKEWVSRDTRTGEIILPTCEWLTRETPQFRAGIIRRIRRATRIS